MESVNGPEAACRMYMVFGNGKGGGYRKFKSVSDQMGCMDVITPGGLDGQVSETVHV